MRNSILGAHPLPTAGGSRDELYPSGYAHSSVCHAVKENMKKISNVITDCIIAEIIRHSLSTEMGLELH